MVLGQDEAVLLARQAQRQRLAERAGGQIEDLAGGADGDRLGGRGGIAGRQRAQIDELERARAGAVGLLPSLAIDVVEDGAQGFMAVDDGLQTGGEGAQVERAGQIQHEGDVVDGAPAEQAVEEPQTALGEGQGRDLVAGHGRDGLAGEARATGQVVGQLGQARVLEHGRDGQLNAE